MKRSRNDLTDDDGTRQIRLWGERLYTVIRSVGENILIESFQRTGDGEPGEVEASGKVCLGDRLVSIDAKKVTGLNTNEVSKIVKSSKRPILLTFDRISKSTPKQGTDPESLNTSDQSSKKSKIFEQDVVIVKETVNEQPVSEESIHADAVATEKLVTDTTIEVPKSQSDINNPRSPPLAGSTGPSKAPEKHEDAPVRPMEGSRSTDNDQDNKYTAPAQPSVSADRIVRHSHANFRGILCDESNKTKTALSNCDTSKSHQNQSIDNSKNGCGEEEGKGTEQIASTQTKHITSKSDPEPGDQESTENQREYEPTNASTNATVVEAEQPSLTSTVKAIRKPLPSIEELNRHRHEIIQAHLRPKTSVNTCQAYVRTMKPAIQTTITHIKPAVSAQPAHYGGPMNAAVSTSQSGVLMNTMQQTTGLSFESQSFRGHRFPAQNSRYRRGVVEQQTPFVNNNDRNTSVAIAQQRTMTSSNHVQGISDKQVTLTQEAQQRSIPSRQHNVPLTVHRDRGHPVSMQLSGHGLNSSLQSLGVITRPYGASTNLSQQVRPGSSSKSPAAHLAGKTHDINVRKSDPTLESTQWQHAGTAIKKNQAKVGETVAHTFTPTHHTTNARAEVLAQENSNHSSVDPHDKQNSIRRKASHSDQITSAQDPTAKCHDDPIPESRRTIVSHQSNPVALNQPIFLEPVSSWNHRDYTAISIRKSRLYVKLATFQEQVILTSFLKGENNECGEIEQSGQVLLGDVLVAINGNCLKSVSSPHQIAKLVTGLPRPFHVYFRRAMWEELQH